MLGAAQADAFGAELARALRVLGQVGVGAHPEAAELVGPAEDRAEVAGRFGRDDRDFADDDLAGRAGDRDDVAFAHGLPPATNCFAATSILSASAPQIAGLPIPRATTAACDTRPPRDVRMPSAAIIPCRSSGDVSGRTRITRSPAS